MKYLHCSKCSCYHGEAYDCTAMRRQRELAIAMRPASEIFGSSVGKSDNVYEKEIWNRAINGCQAKLKEEFVASDVVCEIIGRLKK